MRTKKNYKKSPSCTIKDTMATCQTNGEEKAAILQVSFYKSDLTRNVNATGISSSRLIDEKSSISAIEDMSLAHLSSQQFLWDP